MSGQVAHCPEHGVATYPDAELCDHFYLCVNGTLTYEKCENGLLFDGKGAVHNHCNYNWAVECGDRKADRKLQLINNTTTVNEMVKIEHFAL